MRKKIITLIVAALFLTGCGNSRQDDDRYQQSLQKAKEALIEKKLDEAEGFLDLALENKRKGEEATRLKIQLDYYNQGITAIEEDRIKEAEIAFDNVVSIKDGSKQLTRYAKKERESLSNFKKKEVKKETAREVQEEVTSLWTPEKEQRLSVFMERWGETMNQTYQSYHPSNNVNYYGIMLPQAILENEMYLAVNGRRVSSQWSETGTGEEEYQIVALYSDSDTQAYLSKHVYLFVYFKEEPIVLVTQQNQGNDDNNLSFTATENDALREGFSNIADGESR